MFVCLLGLFVCVCIGWLVGFPCKLAFQAAVLIKRSLSKFRNREIPLDTEPFNLAVHAEGGIVQFYPRTSDSTGKNLIF